MSGQHVHDHQGHDHGHVHGHLHEPVGPVRSTQPAPDDSVPSLLMHSARSRVAAALATLAVLWLAVAWALMEVAP